MIYMKQGRPINKEITENIEKVMQKRYPYTIKGVQQLYKNEFGNTLSWNTIRYHINILIEKKVVEEEIITKGIKVVSVIRKKV